MPLMAVYHFHNSKLQSDSVGVISLMTFNCYDSYVSVATFKSHSNSFVMAV